MSKKKNAKKEKVNDSKFLNGLIYFGLFGLLALIMCGVFGKSGDYVKNFLLGTFGYSIYGLAFGGVAIGLLYIFGQRPSRSGGVIFLYIAMMFLIVAMCHLGTARELSALSYGDYIKACYVNHNTAGGALGGVMFYPFAKLFALGMSLFALLLVGVVALIIVAQLKYDINFKSVGRKNKNKKNVQNVVMRKPNQRVAESAQEQDDRKLYNGTISGKQLSDNISRKFADKPISYVPLENELNDLDEQIVGESGNDEFLVDPSDVDDKINSAREKALEILYSDSSAATNRGNKKVDASEIKNKLRGENSTYVRPQSTNNATIEKPKEVDNSMEYKAYCNNHRLEQIEKNLNKINHVDEDNASEQSSSTASFLERMEKNFQSNFDVSNKNFATESDESDEIEQLDNIDNDSREIDNQTSTNPEPMQNIADMLAQKPEQNADIERKLNDIKEEKMLAEREERRALLEQKKREMLARRESGQTSTNNGNNSYGNASNNSSNGNNSYNNANNNSNNGNNSYKPNNGNSYNNANGNLSGNSNGNSYNNSINNAGDGKPTISFGGQNANNTQVVKPIVTAPPRKISPYCPPDLSCLVDYVENVDDDINIDEKIQVFESKMKSFGIDVKVINVVKGPRFSRLEFETTTELSKVTAKANDMAMWLEIPQMRLEAPIPGKSFCGIEIPNHKSGIVGLKSIITSPKFNNVDPAKGLFFALGKDIDGTCYVSDISGFPHGLVAGASGTGKSVCLNAMICSLLYKYSPQELRLILIDPKVVEFNKYRDIPHLLLPNIITEDQQVINALEWAVNEMEERYHKFADKDVSKISEYNKELSAGEEKMPYILIVVDEVGDIILSKTGKEFERLIKRLTAKARAAGIHLILATQRPSVDVITGTIKANLPTRIAFSVSSGADSRTILDMYGAEKLLRMGDMLYLGENMSSPRRIQCAFIDNPEIKAVLKQVRERNENYYDENIESVIMKKKEEEEIPVEKRQSSLPDKLCIEVLETCLRWNSNISVTLFQKKLGVGYPRAAKLFDWLVDMHYVKVEGKSRMFTLSEEEVEEIKMRENDGDDSE
ncbi:MAG: DNA translocase FtsK [Clostridia bacterium]